MNPGELVVILKSKKHKPFADEETHYARSSTTSLCSLSNGNLQVGKRHGLRNIEIPFFKNPSLKHLSKFLLTPPEKFAKVDKNEISWEV
jgi:hypothetical protein